MPTKRPISPKFPYRKFLYLSSTFSKFQALTRIMPYAGHRMPNQIQQQYTNQSFSPFKDNKGGKKEETKAKALANISSQILQIWLLISSLNIFHLQNLDFLSSHQEIYLLILYSVKAVQLQIFTNFFNSLFCFPSSFQLELSPFMLHLQDVS